MTASLAERMPCPLADRDQIVAFTNALFRYADDGTFIQLRCFRDDVSEIWRHDLWRALCIDGGGLAPVTDAAVELASAAGAAAERVVFCPPVATFKSSTGAAEKDIANGLVLAVECDTSPEAARGMLEALLGPATIVVASGGSWTDPATGEVWPKLHLYWRLTEPTRNVADHMRLQEARWVAMLVVGSDASAVPLCHPLRWPGSWHRKDQPRLALIVQSNLDTEIELRDALDQLRDAASAAGLLDPNPHRPGRTRSASDPQADPRDIAAALTAIPNADVPWSEWNRIGLAAWRASSGSETGFSAFAAWSAKSTKYDPAETRRRWEHYRTSPPSEIGAGSLFHMAREAVPGWVKPTDFPRGAAPTTLSPDLIPAPPGGGGTGSPVEPFTGLDPIAVVPEFPVLAQEAFTGLPGEIVSLIKPHTESDPVGLLLSAHAFFGNCVGRGPHYRVESTEHGPNLFVLKVGDSAKARKGTGEDRILSLFRHVDEEWTCRRLHTGLSSGEGVIWEVRNPITRLSKEGRGSSATLVEETVDAGVEDKRLLVIESEFAGALRVMHREGNILSRVLRDAWDRGDLATMTKNSPARANGACISIIGHITAPELRECFDRTEMANGFGNRFLFACVRRSKLLPFGGSLPDRDVLDMAGAIRVAVQRARAIGQVRMSFEAADAWREIYGDLSGDRPGLLGSLTARAEAQVVRLATLYALWAGTDQIELEHLMAAVAIEAFCRESVGYIFGDALGDPVADTILAALKGAGQPGLTRTEINNLFQRNVPAIQIARALGELSRRRLATQSRGEAASGRPPEIWKIAEGNGV